MGSGMEVTRSEMSQREEGRGKRGFMSRLRCRLPKSRVRSATCSDLELPKKSFSVDEAGSRKRAALGPRSSLPSPASRDGVLHLPQSAVEREQSSPTFGRRATQPSSLLKLAVDFLATSDDSASAPAVVARSRSAPAGLRYQADRVVGKGSSGSVRHGVDLLTGEEVAMKFIPKNSEALELVRAERAAMERLEHGQVVRLRDTFETDDSHVLVMDYAQGGDLLDWILRRQQQGIQIRDSQVAWICAQVALGIDHCHRRGIVHCDIKPDNLLIDSSGRVKLVDYGLSVDLAAGEEQPFIGTIYYTAPEVLSGRKLEARDIPGVDVWSLGILAYVMTVGRFPFYGSTREETRRNVCSQQDLRFPDHVSPRVRRFISSLLRRDPAERPTIRDVIRSPFLSKYIAKLQTEQRTSRLQSLNDVPRMYSELSQFTQY